MFQAVIEVKVEGAIERSEIAEGLREQRMSGSVCPGGSDIDMGPDDISRYVVIRGAPHIIGGGFVETGGLEPP